MNYQRSGTRLSASHSLITLTPTSKNIYAAMAELPLRW